jgi:hypothetical protein
MKLLLNFQKILLTISVFETCGYNAQITELESSESNVGTLALEEESPESEDESSDSAKSEYSSKPFDDIIKSIPHKIAATPI